MKKILLIDDSDFDRKMIRFAIQQEDQNCIFYEASNGKQGWKMATSIRPDITVLDLRMPHMDGFETLDCIRQSIEESTKKPLNVYILSGSDDENEFFIAMSKGAQNFFTKPDDLNGYKGVAKQICGAG